MVGTCSYCEHELWSLCDNTHPKPELAEPMLGYPPAAIPGYSHAFSVLEQLREMTGGCGPDACIEAVGMEAHGTGPQYAHDRVKQALHLHTDRGSALREAAMAVRKGGVLSVMGIYGVIDKFPFGVLTNKGITMRTSQQPGQRNMGRMLEHVQAGDLDPSFLVTHRMSLEQAPRGYEMFKKKEDGCLRVAFKP